jgi:hypothetical protein
MHSGYIEGVPISRFSEPCSGGIIEVAEDVQHCLRHRLLPSLFTLQETFPCDARSEYRFQVLALEYDI